MAWTDVRLYLPALALAAVGVWGYLDLRGRIDAIPVELAAAHRLDPQTPFVGGGPGPSHGSTADLPPSEAPIADASRARASRCAGMLTEEQARSVVGAHGAEVFACYERHGRSAGVRGRLMLEIRVASSGKVDAVVASGELATHRPLVECVYDAIEAWPFPAPEGDGCALVQAPFLLGSDAN